MGGKSSKHACRQQGRGQVAKLQHCLCGAGRCCLALVFCEQDVLIASKGQSRATYLDAATGDLLVPASAAYADHQKSRWTEGGKEFTTAIRTEVPTRMQMLHVASSDGDLRSISPIYVAFKIVVAR